MSGRSVNKRRFYGRRNDEKRTRLLKKQKQMEEKI
jgi:hypothetical protein